MTSTASITLASKIVIVMMLGSSCVGAARILMITFQMPSHVIMKLGIATDLIGRGHHVHFLLAANNPIAVTVRNLGIDVISYQPASGVLHPYTAEFEDVMSEMILNRTFEQPMLSDMVHEDCKTIMSDQRLIDNLKDLKFDMIVLEPFMVNPCYLLIPHELGVRYTLALCIVPPLLLHIPALPSVTGLTVLGPSLVQFPLLQSLSERLSNGAWYIVLHNLIIPKLWADTSLMRKYAPEVNSWEELILRSEIMLIENDHLLDVAWPLLPHVVTIAGCTARPPVPLSDDLERIMAMSGEDGVILVSFGSTAHRMPADIVVKFLTAFKRVRQAVVTKMAIPAGISVPDNVHLVKWLPQNDILGHPKTKLFITHCGTNGQNEALFHGVPMLGIPMFAEQGWNCGRAQHRGLSLCLDLMKFTADELHDNIVELIENTTYRTNVRRLSEIRKDEPLNGCQKAGHWISHVIKYGGKHLRSPALELSLYQILMFDVLGVILVVVLVLIVFIWFVVVSIVKFMRKSMGHAQKKKNQ